MGGQIRFAGVQPCDLGKTSLAALTLTRSAGRSLPWSRSAYRVSKFAYSRLVAWLADRYAALRPSGYVVGITIVVTSFLNFAPANAATYNDIVACWEQLGSTGVSSICFDRSRQVSHASRSAASSCRYPRGRVQLVRDTFIIEIPAGSASCSGNEGQIFASAAGRLECRLQQEPQQDFVCKGSWTGKRPHDATYRRVLWDERDQAFFLEDVWNIHPDKDFLIGRQSMNDGRWDRAENRFKKAVEDYKRYNNANNHSIALMFLGMVRQELGRYEEAENDYLQAHSLLEQIGGDTGFPLHLLAMLNSRQEKFDAAARYFERSRAIWEQTSGATTIRMAGSLTAQGRMYLNRDEHVASIPAATLDQAEPLLRQALRIAKNYPGEDVLALALRNLGLWAMHRAGKTPRCKPIMPLLGGSCRAGFSTPAQIAAAKESEALLLQAIALQEQLHGRDSREVGETVLILAELYENRERDAEANEAYKRANGNAHLNRITVFYGTNRLATDASERISEYSDTAAAAVRYGYINMRPMHEQIAFRDIRQGTGSLDLSEGQLSVPTRFIVDKRGDGYTFDDLGLTDPETSAGRDAIIFVHGFDTSFRSALRQATQIAFDLSYPDVFLFSWPAQGRFGYFTARGNVGEAAKKFNEFLESIERRLPRRRLHVIAHSMGSQVVLSAMRDRIRKNGAVGMVGEIVLAHPDASTDEVAEVAARLLGISIFMTIYAAQDDWALRLSRWVNFTRRAGGTAVVYDGVDTIDITGLVTEFWTLKHNSYVVNSMLFGDIARVLKGIRPPDKRTKYFERVENSGGIHWRYKANH